MTLLAKVCAALAAPFFALGAFVGAGNHAATSTPPHGTFTASTTASSTIGTGNWHKPPYSPAHPMKPATTTPSSIQLTSLSPTSGPVGTSVTIDGSGFTSGSIVRFGPGAITNVSVASDGSSLTFSVPSSAGPYCEAGKACPMFEMLVTPNTYKVFVQDGTSTTAAADFTVTGTSTAPTTTHHPVIWANL